jgi:hypothetical protein
VCNTDRSPPAFLFHDTFASGLAMPADLSAQCQRLLDQIRKRCPELLPADPVPSGTVVGPVHITPAEARKLVPPAAAIAAGIDRFADAAAKPVKWREGDREVLVFAANVSVRFAPGLIAVSMPAFCDQTGKAVVHVSFVVGDPKQPAGLVAVTESRPRGPATIVDAWGDAFVAFAWHIVLEVATTVAGESGRDVDGSRLVPIAIAASADGLFIVPMARHAFDRVRG